jgi:hypothetical protein
MPHPLHRYPLLSVAGCSWNGNIFFLIFFSEWNNNKLMDGERYGDMCMYIWQVRWTETDGKAAAFPPHNRRNKESTDSGGSPCRLTDSLWPTCQWTFERIQLLNCCKPSRHEWKTALVWLADCLKPDSDRAQHKKANYPVLITMLATACFSCYMWREKRFNRGVYVLVTRIKPQYARNYNEFPGLYSFLPQMKPL